MNTYTYTYVKARAEAIVDQVDMFLQYACIQESSRIKILKGIDNRWLSHVGVYLVRSGRRFLEAEIGVDWELHSDLVKLTPTVRTDLPGWEGGAAPEVRTIGRRFGLRAKELQLQPSYWVRFLPYIRNNESRYRELCIVVGVDYASFPPAWESTPTDRTYRIDDLEEVHTSLRST